MEAKNALASRKVPVGSSLEKVKQEIEEWRQRSQVGPMPERLWDMTVSAARVHGIHRTARALGLHYAKVKRRMKPMPQEVREGPATPGVKPDFMEVDCFAVLRAKEGPVVEVVNPQGARLTLRFPCAESVDVLGLVSAFAEGR
jgi:hypothetical protein